MLLSTGDLSLRLRREEQALEREADGPLRQERGRLVEQLRRNLSAAHQGMDEREARLLALSTRLEAIEGASNNCGARSIANGTPRKPAAPR